MPYKPKGSTVWWISYTSTSGKRIRETTGTRDKRQAEALEADRRQAVHRVVHLGEAEDRSFDEVLSTYLKASTQKRSHSRDLDSARHLMPHFTGHNIGQLSAADIVNYKKARALHTNAAGLPRPPSEATVAKELLLLSRAIRYCNTEFDWQLPNPVTKRAGSTGNSRKVPRWLTPEEAQTLIHTAARLTRSPHMTDFIELGLATGMRKDEMLGLEWRRVDLQRKLIWFDSVDGSKSGRGESVPLNQTAIDALTRRKAWNRQKGLHAVPWVFASHKKPGQRISDIKTGWRGLIKQSGITGIVPHTLRHTFCSWLVQAGEDLRKVADLMRHNDIRTTMLYAHLAPKTGNETAAIDRILNQSQSKFGQSEQIK